MERVEAVEIIKTLAAIYIAKPFEQERTREEYIKPLMELDVAYALEAIKKLKLTCKFCPTPAEIYEEYKRVERIRKADIEFQNRGFCFVCNNDGFIEHKKGEEYTSKGKKVVLYRSFILYCTECDKGQKFKYDGRNVKEHKSYYVTEPVTKYYDIEKLKTENIFKKKEPIPVPDYVLEEARKHGINIKALLPRGA